MMFSKYSKLTDYELTETAKGFAEQQLDALELGDRKLVVKIQKEQQKVNKEAQKRRDALNRTVAYGENHWR